MQVFEGRICQPPPGGNITIVVARFNKTITQRLLDGALAKLRQHNVHESEIRIVWVPGTYELPFIAEHFAKDPACQAIVCLGAVIRGETSHDQHINRYVSMQLGELSQEYGKPVIFGVITCNTVEQANARSGMIESEKDKTVNPAPGNKGAEAAEAALEMIDLLSEVPDYFEGSPESMLSRFLRELDEDEEEVEEDADFLPPSRKRVKKFPRKKK